MHFDSNGKSGPPLQLPATVREPRFYTHEDLMKTGKQKRKNEEVVTASECRADGVLNFVNVDKETQTPAMRVCSFSNRHGAAIVPIKAFARAKMPRSRHADNDKWIRELDAYARPDYLLFVLPTAIAQKI